MQCFVFMPGTGFVLKTAFRSPTNPPQCNWQVNPRWLRSTFSEAVLSAMTHASSKRRRMESWFRNPHLAWKRNHGVPVHCRMFSPVNSSELGRVKLSTNAKIVSFFDHPFFSLNEHFETICFETQPSNKCTTIASVPPSLDLATGSIGSKTQSPGASNVAKDWQPGMYITQLGIYVWLFIQHCDAPSAILHLPHNIFWKVDSTCQTGNWGCWIMTNANAHRRFDTPKCLPTGVYILCFYLWRTHRLANIDSCTKTCKK